MTHYVSLLSGRSNTTQTLLLSMWAFELQVAAYILFTWLTTYCHLGTISAFLFCRNKDIHLVISQRDRLAL